MRIPRELKLAIYALFVVLTLAGGIYLTELAYTTLYKEEKTGFQLPPPWKLPHYEVVNLTPEEVFQAFSSVHRFSLNPTALNGSLEIPEENNSYLGSLAKTGSFPDVVSSFEPYSWMYVLSSMSPTQENITVLRNLMKNPALRRSMADFMQVLKVRHWILEQREHKKKILIDVGHSILNQSSGQGLSLQQVLLKVASLNGTEISPEQFYRVMSSLLGFEELEFVYFSMKNHTLVRKSFPGELVVYKVGFCFNLTAWNISADWKKVKEVAEKLNWTSRVLPPPLIAVSNITLLNVSSEGSVYFSNPPKKEPGISYSSSGTLSSKFSLKVKVTLIALFSGPQRALGITYLKSPSGTLEIFPDEWKEVKKGVYEYNATLSFNLSLDPPPQEMVGPIGPLPSTNGGTLNVTSWNVTVKNEQEISLPVLEGKNVAMKEVQRKEKLTWSIRVFWKKSSLNLKAFLEISVEKGKKPFLFPGGGGLPGLAYPNSTLSVTLGISPESLPQELGRNTTAGGLLEAYAFSGHFNESNEKVVKVPGKLLGKVLFFNISGWGKHSLSVKFSDLFSKVKTFSALGTVVVKAEVWISLPGGLKLKIPTPLEAVGVFCYVKEKISLRITSLRGVFPWEGGYASLAVAELNKVLLPEINITGQVSKIPLNYTGFVLVNGKAVEYFHSFYQPPGPSEFYVNSMMLSPGQNNVSIVLRIATPSSTVTFKKTFKVYVFPLKILDVRAWISWSYTASFLNVYIPGIPPGAEAVSYFLDGKGPLPISPPQTFWKSKISFGLKISPGTHVLGLSLKLPWGQELKVPFLTVIKVPRDWAGNPRPAERAVPPNCTFSLPVRGQGPVKVEAILNGRVIASYVFERALGNLPITLRNLPKGWHTIVFHLVFGDGREVDDPADVYVNPSLPQIWGQTDYFTSNGKVVLSFWVSAKNATVRIDGETEHVSGLKHFTITYYPSQIGENFLNVTASQNGYTSTLYITIWFDPSPPYFKVEKLRQGNSTFWAVLSEDNVTGVKSFSYTFTLGEVQTSGTTSAGICLALPPEKFKLVVKATDLLGNEAKKSFDPGPPKPLHYKIPSPPRGSPFYQGWILWKSKSSASVTFKDVPLISPLNVTSPPGIKALEARYFNFTPRIPSLEQGRRLYEFLCMYTISSLMFSSCASDAEFFLETTLLSSGEKFNETSGVLKEPTEVSNYVPSLECAYQTLVQGRGNPSVLEYYLADFYLPSYMFSPQVCLVFVPQDAYAWHETGNMSTYGSLPGYKDDKNLIFTYGELAASVPFIEAYAPFYSGSSPGLNSSLQQEYAEKICPPLGSGGKPSLSTSWKIPIVQSYIDGMGLSYYYFPKKQQSWWQKIISWFENVFGLSSSSFNYNRTELLQGKYSNVQLLWNCSSSFSISYSYSASGGYYGGNTSGMTTYIFGGYTSPFRTVYLYFPEPTGGIVVLFFETKGPVGTYYLEKYKICPPLTGVNNMKVPQIWYLNGNLFLNVEKLSYSLPDSVLNASCFDYRDETSSGWYDFSIALSGCGCFWYLGTSILLKPAVFVER